MDTACKILETRLPQNALFRSMVAPNIEVNKTRVNIFAKYMSCPR